MLVPAILKKYSSLKKQLHTLYKEVKGMWHIEVTSFLGGQILAIQEVIN